MESILNPEEPTIITFTEVPVQTRNRRVIEKLMVNSCKIASVHWQGRKQIRYGNETRIPFK